MHVDSNLVTHDTHTRTAGWFFCYTCLLHMLTNLCNSHRLSKSTAFVN